VLNVTYEALNVTTVRRAVKLVVAGKAEVLETGDGALHAHTFEMRLPRVVRMLYLIARKRRAVPLTKRNVLLRDAYRCQYCGRNGSDDLTIDHVVPRRSGGTNAWTNLVTACLPCNQRKGGRTPAQAGITLRRKPRRPDATLWLVVRRYPARAEWSAYLFGLTLEERAES
jgi:5-methylcytosine-specific restriction endonuclease McrA